MKNFSLVFVIVIFSITKAIAQDFQGKAFYLSKTNLNTDFTKNIPPDRRQRVLNRLNVNSEKNYELHFNNIQSIFYEQKSLESSSNERFNFFSFMSPMQGILYREYLSKTFSNRVELFGKFFLIKDSLPKNKWVMTGESKKIGVYTCYKATSTKEIPQEVFQFGRRSENSENNKPKTKVVTVEAWFTPQIPISTGPYKMGGLPGLILEVSNDNNKILCTKVVMNPKNKIKIKKPTKGTLVNVSDFNKIRTKKINEMREMFQKRRRSGEGPPRRN